MSYKIAETSTGEIFYSFSIQSGDNVEGFSLIISDLENIWRQVVTAKEARNTISSISPIDVQTSDDLKGYLDEIESLLGEKIANMTDINDSDNEINLNVEGDEGLFKWDFHLRKLDGIDKHYGTKQLANDISQQQKSLETRNAELEKLISQKDFHIQNLLKKIGGVSQYPTREHRNALNVYKKN